MWNDDARKACLATLNDEHEPDLRRVSAEILGRSVPRSDFAVNEALTKRLADDFLSVRRAAVLALGRLALRDGREISLLTKAGGFRSTVFDALLGGTS